MFGKKKDKQPADSKAKDKSSVRIKTIPDIFYGGKDPIIYHAGTSTSSVQKKNKKTGEQKSTQGKLPKSISQSFFRKKSVLVTGGVVLFVLVVAAISWYYIRQSGQAIPRSFAEIEVSDETPKVELSNEESEEPVLSVESEQSTTTEDVVLDETPTTTPALEEQPLEFPSTILVDSVDLDEDVLTDMEEELFGTDTGIQDTDGDGHQDGVEVVNLYNPAGIAPRRLIDSGLVREYINPVFQYRVYYPQDWEVGVVDAGAKQVILSSVTGDFVEVRIVEKNQNQLFVSWFAEHAPSQRFLDVESFTNRFQEDGYKRKDSLVAFFVKDKIVYTLIYHPGTTGNIPYRHVMEMMIQSFRPDKAFVDIPDQPILPSAPTTTDTPIDISILEVQ